MVIRDTIFADAVAAIDTGDAARLDSLISQNPRLVTDRLETDEPGYFADPYLLWFIAENPIRNGRLPANITDIAMAIIDHIEHRSVTSRQAQLDYALGLVATGRVPREAGVQLALIDTLVARGARPEGLDGAIAHGEVAAALRLIHHGARLTLCAAVSLEWWEKARGLLASADEGALADALVTASSLGLPDAVRFLLEAGVNPNLRSQTIHRHASALHMAAQTGREDVCALLINAGASPEARDARWNGVPADWARHAGHPQLAELLRLRS